MLLSFQLLTSFNLNIFLRKSSNRYKGGINKKKVDKEKLARLIASIMGDGHLQIKDWRYITSFYSRDLEEINKINNIVKDLFNKNGKIKLEHSLSFGGVKRKRYRLIFVSREISQTLQQFGTPSGNKTNIAFLVPDWILEGNKKIQSAYIQAIYDTEGYIYRTKTSNRWRISLEMYKRENLIQNEKEFFEQKEICY